MEKVALHFSNSSRKPLKLTYGSLGSAKRALTTGSFPGYSFGFMVSGQLAHFIDLRDGS